MLSGNGRHRRPRQAPALIVAAGVTGSAIAIPLLGATGASAASGTTWDRVAECETGGSWSQNNGDGAYGGLHLTQEDWENYGGLDYASSADQASRSQQIAVAEKLLDDRGVSAWPTCGPLSGLGKDSGSADVDTGLLGDGSSSKSSANGSGSGSGSDAGLSESSTLTDSSSSSPSPSSSSSPSSSATEDGKKSDTGTSGTESHRETDSTPTDGAKGDESDKSEQSAGSWSLVDTGSLSSGRHRGDTADESAAGDEADASSGRHAARTDSAAADTYTVRSGDSLASIADSLDLDGGWRALYAENKDLIGADPSNIVPGQTLDTGVE